MYFFVLSSVRQMPKSMHFYVLDSVCPFIQTVLLLGISSTTIMQHVRLTYKLTLQRACLSRPAARPAAGPRIWAGGPDYPALGPAGEGGVGRWKYYPLYYILTPYAKFYIFLPFLRFLPQNSDHCFYSFLSFNRIGRNRGSKDKGRSRTKEKEQDLESCSFPFAVLAPTAPYRSSPLHIGLGVGDLVLAVEAHEGTARGKQSVKRVDEGP